MLDNCSNSGIINKEDMQQLKDMKERVQGKGNRTFRELYPEWLEFKGFHTNASSYLQRISSDWMKYYLSDPDRLIEEPLDQLNTLELDRWVHKQIKQHNMSKKQYYNMSIILRQGLDFAVRAGYIEKSPFTGVKVNTKMFRKVLKKPDAIEVYLVDEQPKIIEEMYRRFRENPSNTAPLAVVLDFQLGARVGEIVAVKTTDIQGNYIHIQREEVKEYSIQEDGVSFKLKGRKVADYTKSDAGNRKIYLTKEARRIIKLILAANERNREEFEDYLFVRDRRRIRENEVIYQVEKGCERIGISKKGMHKIRKTYISALIDSSLNINRIRELAGHTDERTTYNNYCFNRLGDTQTEQIIEQALGWTEAEEPEENVLRFPVGMKDL